MIRREKRIRSETAVQADGPLARLEAYTRCSAERPFPEIGAAAPSSTRVRELWRDRTTGLMRHRG